MGAAEAMEAEGHMMTPSRRAVIERFEQLVDKVDTLTREVQDMKALQTQIFDRLGWLEGSTAAAESVFAGRLDEISRLAVEFCRLVDPARS